MIFAKWNSKLIGDSQLVHQLDLKDPTGLQENARDNRRPGVQEQPNTHGSGRK
jgi:hypothetical protein